MSLLSMRNIAFLLACLACVAHSRRVQASARSTQFDSAPGSQSLVEQDQSDEQVNVKGRPNPLRKLLLALVAVNPTAQYSGTGYVRQGPPWYSRMFQAGVVDAVVQAVNLVKGLDRFPAVTALCVALSVLAQCLKDRAFTIYDYALQPASAWQSRLLSWQLVASNFMHVSLEHLVDDMSALLSYGTNFESYMEPIEYAKLIAYALVAPNAALVVGTKLWATKSSNPEALAAHESMYVDFAGTLFCLLTIFRYKFMPKGAVHSIHGVPVPIQYAWADVFVSKLANPDMPIVREVSGLIAGLGYVYFGQIRRAWQTQMKKLSPMQRRVVLAGAVFLTGVVLLI
mmetsp:Transcript_48936/g.85151  ORF Transcript_48936/g.85151 Transcript_48936/m.85151 type:complete len:341 (+) Transcript_48936:50-1072(+)